MTITRAQALRMRHGWHPVDVPDTAPTGIPALPTVCALKLNCEKTMRMIDALPAHLRALVHQHDWKAVEQAYPEAIRAAWWKAAENNWGRGPAPSERG